MTYHFSAASIAPIIGCLLTIVRSTIPLREVVSIKKEHRIGVGEVAFLDSAHARDVQTELPLESVMLQEFNPMPFAAMILNHTGWVVYAVLNTDWFIFSAESTGLLCGIWITFSLFPLSSEKVMSQALYVTTTVHHCHAFTMLKHCQALWCCYIQNTVAPCH